MAVTFRNLAISPDDHLSRYGVEGLLTVIERGDLVDWRHIARAVRAEPWGVVALDLVQAVTCADPASGVAATLDRLLRRARQRAVDHERGVVAEQVRDLVTRSGLSRAEFAARIGTSTSRLSTYLSGRVAPSSTLLVRMRRLAP